MPRFRHALGVVAVVVVPALTAPACGSTVEQAVRVDGAVDALGFGDAREIRLTNELGESVVAPVDAGRFRLYALAGHTYSMSVVSAHGATPMAFRRAAGTLAPTFRVRGGAIADIGVVRLFASTPSTTQPVSYALEEAQCSDGGDDVECEDGVDAKTGGPCDDTDEPDGNNHDGEVDDAATDGPVAVPDLSLPDSIGCANTETDDDTEHED